MAGKVEQSTETMTSGRALVRERLIEPLGPGVLNPPRGVAKARHGENMEMLAKKLAWMSADNLDLLRALVADCAEGCWRGRWPAVNEVLAMARSIQEPPRDDDAPRRYMASAAGRRALVEGWHVELYVMLFVHRRFPKGAAALSVLHGRAQRTAAELDDARHRKWRGCASSDDLKMIRWWDDLDARARALIPSGDGGAP